MLIFAKFCDNLLNSLNIINVTKYINVNKKRHLFTSSREIIRYAVRKSTFGLLSVTAETMVGFWREPKQLLQLYCNWVAADVCI